MLPIGYPRGWRLRNLESRGIGFTAGAARAQRDMIRDFPAVEGTHHAE
jgi:hypothetical protein